MMHMDTAESLANAVLGLLVSWAATFFILGYNASEAGAVTAMFFGLSFGRARLLRWIFRGME